MSPGVEDLVLEDVTGPAPRQASSPNGGWSSAASRLTALEAVKALADVLRDPVLVRHGGVDIAGHSLELIAELIEFVEDRLQGVSGHGVHEDSSCASLGEISEGTSVAGSPDPATPFGLEHAFEGGPSFEVRARLVRAVAEVLEVPFREVPLDQLLAPVPVEASA